MTELCKHSSVAADTSKAEISEVRPLSHWCVFPTRLIESGFGSSEESDVVFLILSNFIFPFFLKKISPYSHSPTFSAQCSVLLSVSFSLSLKPFLLSLRKGCSFYWHGSRKVRSQSYSALHELKQTNGAS